MARYEIRHARPVYPSGIRVDVETRARKDSAEYLFRRLVREELVAGYAGLDTQWGWTLCRTAWRLGAEIMGGVPIGWSATVASDNPTHGGESLEIRRVA
jgi:hypothetical protein